MVDGVVSYYQGALKLTVSVELDMVFIMQLPATPEREEFQK